MLRPFAALVWKDLRLFFADRRAVLMSVAAPIVIASFFGFIFGRDDMAWARRLRRRLADSRAPGDCPRLRRVGRCPLPVGNGLGRTTPPTSASIPA